METVKHISAVVEYGLGLGGDVGLTNLQFLESFTGNGDHEIVISSGKTNMLYILHLLDRKGKAPGGGVSFLAAEKVKKWLEEQGLEAVSELSVIKPIPENPTRKHVTATVSQAISGKLYFQSVRYWDGWLGNVPGASIIHSPMTNIEYVVELSGVGEHSLGPDTMRRALEEMKQMILQHEAAQAS